MTLCQCDILNCRLSRSSRLTKASNLTPVALTNFSQIFLGFDQITFNLVFDCSSVSDAARTQSFNSLMCLVLQVLPSSNWANNAYIGPYKDQISHLFDTNELDHRLPEVKRWQFNKYPRSYNRCYGNLSRKNKWETWYSSCVCKIFYIFYSK